MNAFIRSGFSILIILFSCLSIVHAQQLNLKTGIFSLDRVERNGRSTSTPHYLFYTPGRNLTAIDKQNLESSGIEILYALKGNIYWVRIEAGAALPARDMYQIDPLYKLAAEIDGRSVTQSLRLSIAPGLSTEMVIEWAKENQIKLLDIRALTYGMIDVEILSSNLTALIQTEWVSYIQLIPKDEEINFRLLNAERGWTLKSDQFHGLTGDGVTVGIGDGGRLGKHEDLSRSVLDLSSYSLSTHATQVTGIVTGSGLIDPSFGFGYAPSANVLVRNFSNILWDAPQYVSDFNLSLTNNSYGSALENCNYIGDYDASSFALDAMMMSTPQLLHVFAAGNSGGLTCTPYPMRYATIAGGYQCAKNVLTVGAIQHTDIIAAFSSRGPVDDGRLKPEVVAYGLGRFSTVNNHLYTSNSGTSFSSPATVGMATLLSQHYKTMHNDSLPDAALIKNIICNSADDLGVNGPDYTFGFGRINGDRAIQLINASAYDSVIVHQNSAITRTFSVPAGVASVDVMLLWNDYPSAPYETVTLVNDIDMLVIDPSGDTLRPWKLNYTPSGVATQSSTGAEHLNNYEQVTIPAAEQGIYIVLIKGYDIAMGPQAAWLSWDMHYAGIKVQSPVGDEIFRPGDAHYLRWDAYGSGNASFTADYSTDGGVNWIQIPGIFASTARQQSWTVPGIHTDKLKVRINASNGMSDISDFNASIMPSPANLMASSPCDGYLNISWSAVTNADYYRIYKIVNETLVELDTTSGLSIVIGDLDPGSSQWIAVSGVFPSGENGMRSRAISVLANGGNNCGWDHDLRLDSLVNPVSGRQFTSSTLSSTEQINIYLTNAGILNASGFTLSYQVNTNSVITQAFAGTINAGTGQYFLFTQSADLSSAGIYNIRVWTNYSLDPFKQNDTIKFTIHHLSNPVISLPWTENFESAADTIVSQSTTGIPGLDNVDAILSGSSRVRTFAGSTFTQSGQRAMTMDAASSVVSHGDVILTFNLGNYDVNVDDIRMSLYYMHHELIPDPNNTEAIFIRGSDLDTFVLLHELTNPVDLRGQWQYITGLEVTELLSSVGQNLSSSFQVKFPYDVNATAGDPFKQDGQTIDDIAFHRIDRDVRLVDILFPVEASCGLSMESITVSVENTSFKPVPSTSISYRVNNGPINTTAVGTIPFDTTLIFQLTPLADFTNSGVYELTVWVSSASDPYKLNDTIRKVIVNSPLINEFPYREEFESGNVGWHTAGINSSWQYGAPGKNIISRAAEGDKAWVTNLSTAHHADEESYLYSPCFDLSGMGQPYLSFAMQYQLEVNYDFSWVEYRLEGSDQWNKLISQGNSTNWYNHVSNAWNGTQSKWITTGTSIPFTDTTIQFRWVMQSDVGVELEGVAIDQVNIYDRLSIASTPIQVSAPVIGDDWTHIDYNGQRIFSIHPQGQDLGIVTVTLYKSNLNFINADSFYLLSRNWLITATNSFQNPVSLRGYFSLSEANQLVSATGCAQCLPSRDGFDVAAVRYSGINEDGLFTNNVTAGVKTYSPDITDVFPYENGYYAEWETSALSEWWISTPVVKKAGTLIRKITTWSDDAEEHLDNGSVNPRRERLAMTDYNGNQKVGWRFKNISIPAGSVITSAHIKWTSSSVASTPSAWTLQSQVSPDANTFTSGKYDISLRSRSNQVVQWSPSSWSTGQLYSSPDIRHLIQQVVDQLLWVNGNDLVLIMRGSGLRETWSMDGDSSQSAELVIAFDALCTDNQILFVDKDAIGNQDGTSWVNAYRNLEQALDRASHCPSITQIWIAEGKYTPFTEVPRDAGFKIRQGLEIYGGFVGNESSIEQRVYGSFPTLLSGDIGTLASSDNLYHVVHILPGSNPVVLNGITIQEGMANGPSPSDQTGSGVFNQGVLHCHQVIIQDSSYPSFYNAQGSELKNLGVLDIRE